MGKYAFLYLPRTPNSGPLKSNETYRWPPQSYRGPSEGMASMPTSRWLHASLREVRSSESGSPRPHVAAFCFAPGSCPLSLQFGALPKTPLGNALSLTETHCWGQNAVLSHGGLTGGMLLSGLRDKKTRVRLNNRLRAFACSGFRFVLAQTVRVPLLGDPRSRDQDRGAVCKRAVPRDLNVGTDLTPRF